MAQGFVRSNNLAESDTGSSDAGILDNLGGAGITEDIRLFDGNFRAQSVLTSADYIIDGSEIVVGGTLSQTAVVTITNIDLDSGDPGQLIETSDETVFFNKYRNNDTIRLTGTNSNLDGDPATVVRLSTETQNYKEIKVFGRPYETTTEEVTITSIREGRVAFSDGTLLSYNNSEYRYRVVNSNTIDRFSLVDTQNNDALFVPFILGIGDFGANDYGSLARSDSIKQSDLFNLNTPRPSTTSQGGGGGGGNLNSVAAADEGGLESLFDEAPVDVQISFIQQRLSIFDFKSSRVPVTTRDSVLNSDVTFRGALTITNVDNEPITDSAPGLFIVSGTQSKRAFQDRTNPWEETGTQGSGTISLSNISPTTVDAQAESLVLEPLGGAAPVLNFGSSPVINTESILISTYTHKLPVTINGEDYFFLLVES